MVHRITSGEHSASPHSKWILSLGVAALAAGCSGGGGQEAGGSFDPEGGGGPNFNGVDDGNVREGDVVAELVMEAPAAGHFVLSATVPVPRGTLTDGSLVEPLSVRVEGDRAAPTQVEIVSRYPDPADGADVVRVLAHVRKPDGAQEGDMIKFQVGANPHPKHDLELHSSVQSLLDAPGTIRLIGHDVFGHKYGADLMRGIKTEGPGAEILMDGHVARQYRTHEIMLPNEEVDGSQGTLPHMMGVHSYITAWRGEQFLSLDLHVHNGMDGLDPGSSEDDAMGDLYFQDLAIRLPQGWRVGYAIDTDASGDIQINGGWALAPIVKENADGKLHVLPSMSHFTRRLVVFHPGAEDKALEMVRSGFQAFCAPGYNQSGHQNWSWWNESTARYFPQNHVLPNLDYIGQESVRNALAGKWNAASSQIESGAAGQYPIISPRLGWAHPWGVAYGGMTGGDEIDIFSGTEIAWSASRDGFRLAQLQQRCYVDRQPQALFDRAGEPTKVEDLLVTEGFGAPYVDLWYYVTMGGSADPFGFSDAPTHQIDSVQAQNLAADYSDDLKSYASIDYQHYIRYTRNLKTLAWLSGDAMSKELLLAATENFRLSFHEHNNSSYGHAQVTGLRMLQNEVGENPGMGLAFGRGPAWGMDCAIAGYAMASPERRAQLLPWIRKVADVLDAGQSTCTGNIMSTVINSHYQGTYRSRQAMEESFAENVLRSLATTVFDDVEPERAMGIQQDLVASVRSTISDRFWSEENGAPWFYAATGPADQSLGDFCAFEQTDLHGSYTNTTAYYSSFAYAYDVDPDPEFLFRAAQMMGGGNLWNGLNSNSLNNLNNTAALVALCQLMGEDQL